MHFQIKIPKFGSLHLNEFEDQPFDKRLVSNTLPLKQAILVLKFLSNSGEYCG